MHKVKTHNCPHCGQKHPEVFNYCPTEGKKIKPTKVVPLNPIYLIVFVSICVVVSLLIYNFYFSRQFEPDKKITNTIGMNFVYIQSGQFVMGSENNDPDKEIDEKQRLQSVSNFYMQTTEITQQQWFTIMKTKPWIGKRNVKEGPDFPAVNISWYDCQLFVETLNKIEKTTKYRLPYEDEWEYACRAGMTTRFHWGNDLDCTQANFGSGSLVNRCLETNPGHAKKVKSFSPNAWGLYDMHGNVWEWCDNNINPLNENGNFKPSRGGAFHSLPGFCRSANRGKCSPYYKSYDQGFRLVMTN